MPDQAEPLIRHNLGLYRLDGFVGRREHLLQLHAWMTGGGDLPAIAISGPQGNGKSVLAMAAAWNNFHEFSDGIVWVGAAGGAGFRLYDIVRTLDTVFGTTLTRIGEERWGIGILEQLYRRKRLLILDELSGATPKELATLVDIIGHLHETGGASRVLLIDRNFSPAIAELVQSQYIRLEGLRRDELPEFLRVRAPQAVREAALAHADELYALTLGRPFVLRLALGLMLDYPWEDLAGLLLGATGADGALTAPDVAAFAVENFASVSPESGPLLDRLVSAAGGASLVAVRDLFWADLGDSVSLGQTLLALQERALIEHDPYDQRVVLHPLVRNYVAQNAVMLGEQWERRHAAYYVHLVRRYQVLPVERWPEIDAEWGNMYKGADWLAGRIERLWEASSSELVADPAIDSTGLEMPPEVRGDPSDLRLARDYAVALAHYAFWRHPPGSLRWLTVGAAAALALGDLRDYGLMLMNIGRHLFFLGRVEEAVTWLSRAAEIFDTRDLLGELAYALTDLGTASRILDRPRQALSYLRAAFECAAQLGDQDGLATAHMNLGSAYYGLHDFARALTEQQWALRIAMRRHNNQQIASVFNSMGLAMEGMERLEEAEQAYQRALETFRRIQDVLGISTCYNNLGSVTYAQGNFNLALSWYELDRSLSEERGAWTDMAATLHNLGHVALEQQAYAPAYRYFAQSKELYAAFQLVDYVREEEEMLEYVRTVAPDVAAQTFL